jgi:signal transduction histidine kinase/CheY-like chemotaxis protein
MSEPRELSYADISPAGRVELLGLAFSRINYGFRAMVIVGLPFIAWYVHLGQRPLGLLLWTASYLVGLLVVHRLYQRYERDRAQGQHDATWRRWLPRVQGIALVYGSSMAAPPLLTAGHATFEFQLIYMASVAAIIAGNSVHSSPVLSVFRCFLLTGWGGVTLLVPATFPDHWHYVLPLALLHTLTMLRHSAISHRFFLKNIVLQEHAEKALYDKNLFLTTASHDLRQPVHAMGFLVESISQRNHDPALEEALADLRQSVRSASQMFNALLDLSRIESGRLQVHPEAVNLVDVVRNVATTFAEEARIRGLTLRVHVPRQGAVVLADTTLLRQSLSNLLHNALRYTLRGGILLAVRRRGAAWRCEVWDTGIGMAALDDADIFSPFFRNEHAKGIDSAGHGLGLAVVARCCALMNAPYGFRSREQKGSCFWVQLPATTPAPAALPDVPHAADRAAPLPRWSGCCLVVDDDPLVRNAWAALMQSWGLQVHCVESGAQALRLLDEGLKPNAIFCDQRLRSGESGFNLLRTLLDRLPQASGAMISGELNAPELAAAEEQGYLVLRKPLEPQALQAVLGHWLASD